MFAEKEINRNKLTLNMFAEREINLHPPTYHKDCQKQKQTKNKTFGAIFKKKR